METDKSAINDIITQTKQLTKKLRSYLIQNTKGDIKPVTFLQTFSSDYEKRRNVKLENVLSYFNNHVCANQHIIEKCESIGYVTYQDCDNVIIKIGEPYFYRIRRRFENTIEHPNNYIVKIEVCQACKVTRFQFITKACVLSSHVT